MKATWIIALSISSTLAAGCVPSQKDEGENASTGGVAGTGQGGAAGATGGAPGVGGMSGAGEGGAGAMGGSAGSAGGGGSAAGGPELPPGWTASTHPCFGNRTDALHYDDDHMTAWVGCGTTTTGFGLFRSQDGGINWAAPETDPPQALDGFRVNDISRSSDGRLYVSGTDNGSRSVVSLDTSVAPYKVDVVLKYGTTIDTGFVVGGFRRAPDGSALAESLNGYQLLFRPSDAVGPNPQSWVDAYYWADGGAASYQILDLEEHDGKFYGCGATIAEPPKVYLPNPNASDPWKMSVVVLDSSYAGEMWGIDVDPSGGVVVGGVNQDSDRGMIYVSQSNPLEPSDWLAFDVSQLVPSSPTWIRGVCTNGSRIVAVGEYPMTQEPLLLVSNDGGKSFSDMTPDAPSVLSECTVFPNGSVAVAGGEGYVGVYVPE